MKKLLVLLVVLSLLLSPSTALADEWIQHPVTGEYWSCGYYSDGYWCWSAGAGWFRALPGWQYGVLGG